MEAAVTRNRGNEQAKGIQGLVNRLALMKVSRNNGAAVTKDSLGLLWKVMQRLSRSLVITAESFPVTSPCSG